MKHISTVTALLLLMGFSSLAFAERTTIDTVTLQPGESKAFSIGAEAKTKIGFEPKLTFEQRKKCVNMCIELSKMGGKAYASPLGGAMGMQPEGGKIEAILKNLESFPIEVELYRK